MKKNFFMISFVFFIIISGAFIALSVFTQTKLPSITFSTLTLSTISYVLWATSPSLPLKRDERGKFIIQKSLAHTGMLTFIYLFIFLTIFYFKLINLDKEQILLLFSSLIISTAFLSILILNKKY
ncbi:hypothetical protein [Bacillus amyloliquefaciens]|uniref:hypothetical protein n=1 Tax=Bacillus amyloliquefaciens TaxID=1390 RepID=UPI002DB5BB2B|nr:hypothetical protein [Bacillus amyloliquefaciens]MEC3839607.1 hypothetical protein [Bacillus amyloliquefaciens]